MPSVTKVFHRTRLLPFAILSCSICFAASRGGIPLKLSEGFAFVDAAINGQGPFRMLVDTGATSCILTAEAARRAAVQFDHRVLFTTMTGEKIIPAANRNQVHVGEVIEPDVEIIIAPLKELFVLDPKVDGVLGQSFLSRAPYLIDYRHKRLLLGTDASDAADRLPIMLEPQRVLGRIAVPVLIEAGNRQVSLTLDSGAASLVLECDSQCPMIRDVGRDGALVTYLGEMPVTRGVLHHIKVGGVTLFATDTVLVRKRLPDGQAQGVLPTRLFSAVYVDEGVVRLAH
jgi:hypothetical protein